LLADLLSGGQSIDTVLLDGAVRYGPWAIARTSKD
jgi:hypothetical protein